MFMSAKTTIMEQNSTLGPINGRLSRAVDLGPIVVVAKGSKKPIVDAYNLTSLKSMP